MRKILVVFFLCQLMDSTAAFAETFTFGGKELSIPNPEGFALVTPEMDAVYQLRNTTLVDQNNEIIGFYISELDLPVAIEGEMPPLEKTFRIIGHGDLKQAEIGASDFLKFKEETKKLFAENVSKGVSIIDSAAEKYVKKFNKEADEVFKEDVAMKYHKSILLEPHYENENVLSVSVYMKAGASIDGDGENPFWIAQTLTYLNVAGKILFAYCVAPKDQLEWTREASKKWTEKIIAKNNPPPVKSKGSSGLNLDQVLKESAGGALTGLGIAVFFAFFIALAFGLKKLFRFLKKKYPNE